MRIQHNIMAMNAYRNYNNNTSALSKNLEKLSSGYKINRAGDDAAGLAISEKMRAQITGLNAAQKNVKDGVSLVKTAEGAMQEVHDMLNRMKYLATQSANGTYRDEVDRDNLQKEVNSLREEINRIADSANFNGQKLLNGELDASFNLGGSGNFSLGEVGAAMGTSTILHKEEQAVAKTVFTVDLGNIEYKSTSTNGKLVINIGGNKIGLKLEKESTGLTHTALINKINGLSTGKVTIAQAAGSQDLKISKGSNAKELKLKMGNTGETQVFTVSVANGKMVFTQKNNPTTSKAIIEGDWAVSVSGNGASIGNATSINASTTVNTKGQLATGATYASAAFTVDPKLFVPGGSITIGKQTLTFVEDKGQADVADKVRIAKNADGTVNVQKTLERLTERASTNDDFSVGYNKATGKITVTEKAGQQNYLDADGKSTLISKDAISNALSWDAPQKMGQGLQLQIGDTGDSYNKLTVGVMDMHTKTLGIDAISIKTAVSANAAIENIDKAINKVSETRGDLGAIQNRLEHTGNNLSVMTENIQDAEAAIRDTDVAAEMMAYTKNNILIQSAQAMLAQANQVPQGVLQLLQ